MSLLRLSILSGIYAGEHEEAKTQFARAAQLDLTPADKTELARQPPHA
jgi:hypothetical protein